MVETTLIHEVAVFDGERLLPGPHSVRLRGDRIESIVPSAQVPEEWRQEAERGGHLLSAPGATLFPGLIDLHVHLTWSAGTDPAATLALESVEQTLLRAAGHGQRQLASGITTVRDLGSVADLAIRLAEAVERGWMAGPRVIASGRSIIMTGGHDPFWGLMIDGADEALKAVRTQLYAGARVIKVSATGGAYGRSSGESVDDVELLPEELRPIVDQAHRRGIKVAAHAIGHEGIQHCLDTGIDTIEHGHFLSEDQAERMAEGGVALIPTLYVYRQLADTPGIPDYAKVKAEAIVAQHRRAIELARQAGVVIGAGSDAGSPGTPHPAVIPEIACLVDMGLSPDEALAAATGRAADILGLEEIGRIQPGKIADLILVEGDPTRDVRQLHQMVQVIQGGILQGPSEGTRPRPA